MIGPRSMRGPIIIVYKYLNISDKKGKNIHLENRSAGTIHPSLTRKPLKPHRLPAAVICHREEVEKDGSSPTSSQGLQRAPTAIPPSNFTGMDLQRA